jgi:hypothetical protein
MLTLSHLLSELLIIWTAKLSNVSTYKKRSPLFNEIICQDPSSLSQAYITKSKILAWLCHSKKLWVTCIELNQELVSGALGHT